METILWLAGVLATLYGIKFVFLVFKRLGSKNNINNILDRMEDNMADAAGKVANGIKNRKKSRKEEERPIVTIR